MREDLAKYDGKRRKYRAIFNKIGCRNSHGYIIKTLLLLNVTDVLTHKVVTDHLWFRVGKKFESLNLKEGDQIEFEARVDEYYKGYIGNEWDVKEKDYHLEYPTNLKKLVDPPSLNLLCFGDINKSRCLDAESTKVNDKSIPLNR